ncbi:recombinase family protein [Geodermatophilus sp. SYSU D01119]
MQRRRSVAVYARISQDRDGDGLGVKRQVDDCMAEVERRGWAAAEVYVDDDVSAYTGKTRPAYARMLGDLADGFRDAVVVWHVDRLHRRPVELEHFVATCKQAGVTDVVTVHGDFDLGSGDGLLIARLLSAVAANESDAKRRRGRRKMQEIAEAGRPHGGGTRPFGFEADKVSHRADEAAVIRALTARALAGESLTSLSRWLDAEGVRTVTGRPWRTTTVRQLLLNPRTYGMRSHRNGESLTPAVWQPIISAADGEKLRLLLTDPARRTNRTARRYVLSGLCRCGLCGSVMYSVPRFDTRRYLCRSGTDFGGCGRMAIYADKLERFIVDAVLLRLDSPAMASALTGSGHDDEQAASLATAIESDTERLDELALMYAEGEIDRAGMRKARERIEGRRVANRRALARMTQTTTLDGLVGQGEQLRQRWAELNLGRQAAIIKAVLDHVIVNPAATPGRRGLDISRLQPVWRL